MAIVTISRQVGSLGDEVARLLADTLGVECADKGSLERRLAAEGVPEQVRERFEERRPSLWDSLSMDRYRYLHYLKSAILELAAGGSGVIIGRGSPVFLRGIPNVLHVRLVAPIEVRIRRIQETHGCDEQHAKRVAHHTDHDRAGFYRYFFDVDWSAPELYDLTINTGELNEQQVVDLIRRALDSECMSNDSAAFERALADISLAHAVTTRILYDRQVPLRFFSATAKDGVVTISGVTGIPEDVERCATIAAEVPGVRGVEQAISYVPDHVGLGW